MDRSPDYSYKSSVLRLLLTHHVATGLSYTDSLLLAMAIQVMLYGYKLSFLWIGDEPAQPWTRQPPVKRGL